MPNHRAFLLMGAAAAMLACAACGGNAARARSAAAGSAASAGQAAAPAPGPGPIIAPADQALPPSQTAGFDGQKAYDFTAKLVGFGPRPPASDAIHRTQDYIIAQLKDFGCAVDTDDFHSSTPVGRVGMKNIVAKVPGSGRGIILLLTHYDTDTVSATGEHMSDFVGAVDGGSSSGLMLEMARLACGRKGKQRNAVWIAFLDGEEAFVNWNKDNDNTYGSRELAARLALSGDLKRVRAVVLADMVGPKNLVIRKDSNSTPWMTDLVWKTAQRLGYRSAFVDASGGGIEDDHLPFLHRGVPSVDIIDLADYPYWHTPQDTMDKVSPKSLSIVGHVIVATVGELQNKFH